MKENERNENRRPHIIWNSELKERIDKLFKAGETFAKNRKDFLDQVGRDCAIKKFCERMNFIFIEIPYIVRMEDKIKEGIDKILNKGVLPTDVFPTLIPEKINN